MISKILVRGMVLKVFIVLLWVAVTEVILFGTRY